MADPNNPETDQQDTKTSNPQSGFFIFLIVTLIVTGFKIMMPSSDQLIDASYILIIIITQFMINLGLTKTLCYETNYKKAFMTTIFPWVMLFGVINMMLTIFPGWLSPFSNTFGYFAATLAGSKGTVDSIFIDPTTEQAKSMAKPLAYIYSDRSLLMNQVTLESFDDYWNKSAPLMKTPGQEGYDPDGREKFLKLIRLKTTISKCVWQLLTGGLITAISYNYILNSECTPSIEQTKAEAAARAAAAAGDDNPTPSFVQGLTV